MQNISALIAPSVDTTRVNPLSYRFYDTSEIIKPLLDNGYTVRKYHQLKQDSSSVHLICLVNKNIEFLSSHPEIVVRNSHNGRTSLQLFAGIYRSLCANGLILGDDILPPIYIRHVGIKNSQDKVIDFIQDMKDNVYKMIDVVHQWNETMIHVSDQNDILDNINNALQERKDYKSDALFPFLACDLGNDLWSIYNRLQYSIMNGKSRIIGTNHNGQHVVRQGRPIKSIDATIKVNRVIYNACAQKYQELNSRYL